MDLKKIKEIALAEVLDPDDEYFYMFMCRWYSKTFSTPLKEVLSISPEFVTKMYFQEQYEALPADKRLEEAMMAIDPNYTKNEEESLKDFIDMVEEEIKLGITPKKGDKFKKPNKSQSLPVEESSALKPVVKTFEGLAEAEEASEDNGLDDLDSIVKSEAD